MTSSKTYRSSERVCAPAVGWLLAEPWPEAKQHLGPVAVARQATRAAQVCPALPMGSPLCLHGHSYLVTRPFESGPSPTLCGRWAAE